MAVVAVAMAAAGSALVAYRAGYSKYPGDIATSPVLLDRAGDIVQAIDLVNQLEASQSRHIHHTRLKPHQQQQSSIPGLSSAPEIRVSVIEHGVACTV